MCATCRFNMTVGIVMSLATIAFITVARLCH